MNPIKQIYKLSPLLFCLLLVACGTKKQVEKEPIISDNLSQIYGMRITSSDNEMLYAEGAKWLGVPHRYGGSNKQGVDCSGFVSSGRKVDGKRVPITPVSTLKMANLFIPAPPVG